jgi:hypothetical protein
LAESPKGDGLAARRCRRALTAVLEIGGGGGGGGEQERRGEEEQVAEAAVGRHGCRAKLCALRCRDYTDRQVDTSRVVHSGVGPVKLQKETLLAVYVCAYVGVIGPCVVIECTS